MKIKDFLMLVTYMLLTFGANHSTELVNYTPILCIGAAIICFLLLIAHGCAVVAEQREETRRVDLENATKTLRVVAWIVAIAFMGARYLLA